MRKQLGASQKITDEARAFALSSIPTAFVNGDIVRGAVTHDTLKESIDAQLQDDVSEGALVPVTVE